MKFAYSLNDLICYDENNNFVSSLGESCAIIKKIRVSKFFFDFEFEFDSVFLPRIESLAVIHNKKESKVEKDEENNYKVHIERKIFDGDEISIAAYTKHGKVLLQLKDTLKRKKEALLGNFIVNKNKKILVKREDSLIQRSNKLIKGFKNN